MAKKVYVVELRQDWRGALWGRGEFNVQAPTAEVAIRKAKEVAKESGDFFKTKPIDVKVVREIVTDLR